MPHAAIQVLDLRQTGGELVGNLRIRASKISGGLIEGALTAALIDEIPALAVLGDAEEDDLRFVEAIAQALGSAGLLRICVLSFSSHRDDLNQWRGYSTHGNGYAIGYRAGGNCQMLCIWQ